MENRYKLLLFGQNLYREAALSPDSSEIRIGTVLGCQIRFPKHFCDFEILVQRDARGWNLTAVKGVYFCEAQHQKKYTIRPVHGTTFAVCYEDYGTELFRCFFSLDFEYENKQFDQRIHLSGMETIHIGANPASHIVLRGEYASGETAMLQKTANGYLLKSISTQYGITHNGTILQDEVMLQDCDFFSVADYRFYYKEGQLYVPSSDHLQLNGLHAECTEFSGEALTYPKFSRSSRLLPALNEEEIRLLAPEAKPQKPKSGLFLKLLPVLLMIALTVIVRGMMSETGGSFILFSVCSMAIGALVSIVTVILEKRDYQKELQKRERDYSAYIDQKRSEIQKARHEEEKTLSELYYPFSVTEGFVRNFSGELYDRVPSDTDFLDVRIGTGRREAIRKIAYKPQETYVAKEDSLTELPVSLAEEFCCLPAAPAVLSLRDANVIGVVGKPDCLYEMLKIMFFDVCVRQHYHDTEVFLFIGNDEIPCFQWAKWFHHLDNSHTGCRNIVCDEESKTTILEYLYAEFGRRSEARKKEHYAHIVLYITEDFGIQQHPVSRYIENASEIGVTFVFFKEHKELVPVGCSQFVFLKDAGSGTIVSAKNRNSEMHFSYSPIPDNVLQSLSLRLAPVYCEEINLEGALTKNISLFRLLQIMSVDDLDLEKRWSSSDVTRSMAAPLGVRTGDEIVFLDIHDGTGAHGPHGLVAGTTGSGKSEILQTYILTMASLYHPYEVAFLIIDFKGGGMGNQFIDLPHTLGVITNIDGKGIRRSLTSIKAELTKRQQLFKDAAVDHIDAYIRAYKNGQVSTALPHLIIIVDEFAELKTAHRDFMDELISAARIGRTLGIHLILATQKPKGQVDDQIWSNARFRLCLKVQTPEDSSEVIKTPLAAEIKEAGRAYFMVGNNEIFELFQSAYSGAPANAEEFSGQHSFQISAVDFAGRRTVIYQNKKQAHSSGNDPIPTQKDMLLEKVRQFCKAQQIPKLPNICAPPLPALLTYVPSGAEEKPLRMTARLGVYDHPARQLQEEYILDMTAAHLLIIGSVQTGKTNALQLIIRDMAQRYSPDMVQFYIIDFSSMLLSCFGELAHVGGVVCPNEEEKLNNLFKLLTAEIAERKQKLKSAGVSSFAAYRESGRTDLPLIVLMIDNFSALKELYLSENPVMTTILREGLTAGITVVAANSSTKGVDYRNLNAFAAKISFYNHNSDEYTSLFGTSRLSVEDIPGRCLVTVDREHLDCQTYRSFDGEKEFERVGRIGEFIKEINARYPDKRAVYIPQIPEILMDTQLRAQYPQHYSNYRTILGFDYDTLQPMALQISGLKLIVSGTAQSGKGNFIRSLIAGLYANRLRCPVEIAIFDKMTVKKFASTAEKYGSLITYALSPDRMKELCKEWKTELQARRALVAEHDGDLSVLQDKPLLLMICEDAGKEMLAEFDDTLFEYSAYRFAWICSNAENDDISSIKTPKLYRAKAAGAGFLLFGSLAVSKLFDAFSRISIGEKRERFSAEPAKGDALYVSADDPTKVYRLKTPICGNSDM